MAGHEKGGRCPSFRASTRMWHPLEAIPPEYRGRALTALTVLTALIYGGVGYLGWILRTPEAPQGIVSLALAGDPLVAQSIIAAWSLQQTTLAQNYLIADLTFVMCYSTTLAMACVWSSRFWPPGAAATFGIFLAWCQCGTGLLGAIQNVALFNIVWSSPAMPDGFVSNVARLATLAKFMLVEGALVYVAYTGVAASLGALLRSRQSSLG
jgi:hypothetical protein